VILLEPTMKSTFRVLLLFGVLFLCVLSFLQVALKDVAQADTRPTIITTTGMIADLAKKIGGGAVEVESLMGPGVDPHLYKATFHDLQRLEAASLILYNGLHLEGKMAEVLEKLGARKTVVAVTEKIGREKLRNPPEFAGSFDPHVWFDVRLWVMAGERVRESLQSLEPSKAQQFTEAWAAYREELLKLDDWIRKEMLTIPAGRRVLVTAHDAFGYFGAAYGIEVAALQGISTASEFGLQDVTRLTDLLVKRKIKAIFVEASIPTKILESVQQGATAKGWNVSIGGTLFSDSMGAPGTPEEDYVGMVRHNVRTIVEALR
jgi:manganese/zinc/iron transport system substrate-binding protein